MGKTHGEKVHLYTKLFLYRLGCMKGNGALHIQSQEMIRLKVTGTQGSMNNRVQG